MPDVALNFDGADPSWDLASGVPPWISVLQIIGINIRDQTIFGQFKQATDALMDTMTDSIGDGESGYMVAAVAWLYPDGSVKVPGGEFVVPIGPGREPVDAFARYLIVHGQPAPLPINMRDTTNYVWFRKVNGEIVGSAQPPSLNSIFLQNSTDEADRRKLLGEPIANASGIDQINRSAYWAELAQDHAAYLQQVHQDDLLKQLQANFEKAEQRFNAAYASYIITMNELASLQRSAAVLDKAIAVVGIFEQGAKISAMSTSTGSAVDTSGSPSMSVSTQQAAITEKIEATKDYVIQLGTGLNQREDDLRQQDQQIQDAYNAAGGPVGGLRTPTIVLPPFR